MSYEVECPYCLGTTEFSDYEGGDYENVECDHCNKSFQATAEHEVSFYGEKNCALNNEKHTFIKTHYYDDYYRYKCQVCDQWNSDSDKYPNKELRDQVVEEKERDVE